MVDIQILWVLTDILSPNMAQVDFTLRMWRIAVCQSSTFQKSFFDNPSLLKKSFQKTLRCGFGGWLKLISEWIRMANQGDDD